MSDAQLALKGRFRAPNAHYFGQFFFIINQKSGFIDIASVIITTGQDLYDKLNPSDSWKKYEALINKLKYENKFAQALTTEFQTKLKQLAIDKQFYADLQKAIKSTKTDNINFLLSGFFRRAVKDEEFYLESVTEVANLNDEAEASDEGAPAPGDPSGTYLPVKLDLDPIGGKNVKEIKAGDKILVRILPQTDRANAFIDGQNLRSESGFIKSCAFVVTSVVYPAVGVELVGKLSEGIYGKITEEQNVLVRTTEPIKKIVAAAQASKPLKAATAGENKQTLIMVGGAAAIITLGLILYFVISSL